MDRSKARFKCRETSKSRGLNSSGLLRSVMFEGGFITPFGTLGGDENPPPYDLNKKTMDAEEFGSRNFVVLLGLGFGIQRRNPEIRTLPRCRDLK